MRLQKVRKKVKNQNLTFANAARSFIGYLEGSGKSSSTIKNYRLDLVAFSRFLENQCPAKLTRFDLLTRNDLKAYENHLLSLKIRSNTRRRKLLTTSLFLTYLAKRNKVAPIFTSKVPVPHKIERIPLTVSSSLVIERLRQLEASGVIELRNRCLAWVLAETGCLVSEVTRLKFENFSSTGGAAHVDLPGKAARRVPIGTDLYAAIMGFQSETQTQSESSSDQKERRSFQKKYESAQWVFLGHNRFGPLGGPMTPRGVELLVKSLGPKLGFPILTPRTLRHSAFVFWFGQGHSEQTVQTWLGLKTRYAFKKIATQVSNPASTPHVVNK